MSARPRKIYVVVLSDTDEYGAHCEKPVSVWTTRREGERCCILANSIMDDDHCGLNTSSFVLKEFPLETKQEGFYDEYGVEL